MGDSLAILRIEHKLDLVLHALKANDPILRALITDGDATLSGYGADTCPVCEQPIHLGFNAAQEAFVRDCGCKLPFGVVPGISILLVPPSTKPSTALHLNPDKDGPPDLEPEPSTPSTTTSTRGTAQ